MKRQVKVSLLFTAPGTALRRLMPTLQKVFLAFLLIVPALKAADASKNLHHTLRVNLLLGDVFGLPYSEDLSLGGSAQAITTGIGADYLYSLNQRAGLSLSYFHRGTDYFGGNNGFPTPRLSSLHTLLTGFERVLSNVADDIVLVGSGAVGYTLGTYYPYRKNYALSCATIFPSNCSSEADTFTSPYSTFIHGPTVRSGVGVRVVFTESAHLQAMGFYQISYMTTSSQVRVNESRHYFTHDLYLNLAFGYNF